MMSETKLESLLRKNNEAKFPDMDTSYGSLSQNQNQNDQHQNYYPQPLAMIIPQQHPPQPLAIVRPDPMMPIIDYNFQPFGGDYYCNNFPDHQLNNDQMDPLTIRGPPSPAQYFNDQPELDYTPLLTYDSAPTIDLPELDYTPSLTYSQINSAPQYFNDPPELDYTPLLTYPDQIDSAPTIDPALPQSFYGTDMDYSQLVHPYYNFQVNNY